MTPTNGEHSLSVRLTEQACGVVVDPLTAAFAITSGWFEETPDTPFSWSFYADANKSLGLTPWLASLAEIIGVLPQENSINGLG